MRSSFTALMLLLDACSAFMPSTCRVVQGVQQRTAPSMLAKKAGKKAPASGGFGGGGGGFGAKKEEDAPTLASVCAAMPKRLPKEFTAPCVCGSGDSYADCCRPYHTFKKVAETPEICMRARWAAYAYRLPEYIIASTDKSSSEFSKDKIKWAKKMSMFDGYDFVSLEVGTTEVGPPESGKVEVCFLSPNVFTLQPKNKLSDPPVATAERSKFVKRDGAWLFADGASL